MLKKRNREIGRNRKNERKRKKRERRGQEKEKREREREGEKNETDRERERSSGNEMEDKVGDDLKTVRKALYNLEMRILMLLQFHSHICQLVVLGFSPSSLST